MPSVGVCVKTVALLLGPRLQPYVLDRTGITALQNLKPVFMLRSMKDHMPLSKAVWWFGHGGWKTHYEGSRNVYPWAPAGERRSVAGGIYTQEGCWEDSCARYIDVAPTSSEASWTNFICWPHHSLPMLQSNLNLPYRTSLCLSFPLAERK